MAIHMDIHMYIHMDIHMYIHIDTHMAAITIIPAEQKGGWWIGGR